ncbi:unnamed protein product [Gongylonema pulchrum]|uniref:Uncharacterized protein n=1 Tax=Gongylonema pulchrum TaxID=637853 RepID=A0A183F1K1_9BILA|nr:unnamed protein product [Gongylonema pulchrum]
MKDYIEKKADERKTPPPPEQNEIKTAKPDEASEQNGCHSKTADVGDTKQLSWQDKETHSLARYEQFGLANIKIPVR